MSPLLFRCFRVLRCHRLFHKPSAQVRACASVCLGGARCLECVHSSIFYYCVSRSECGGGRWSLTQLSLGYKPDKSPVEGRNSRSHSHLRPVWSSQFALTCCFGAGGENPIADRENMQTAEISVNPERVLRQRQTLEGLCKLHVIEY